LKQFFDDLAKIKYMMLQGLKKPDRD